MLVLMSLTVFSFFIVIYHHVGYPLILKAMHKWVTAPTLEKVTPLRYSSTTDSRKLPCISILIPAYNEEKHIAEKIRNLALLDYPADRFEVLIASDGSTDRTVEIAMAVMEEPMCEDLQIRIVAFPSNRGKIHIINTLLPRLNGEIALLSDVSALISTDALLVAVQRFENPQVGGVNGNYRLINNNSIGEVMYWKYQSMIRKSEDLLGSVIGAHGACYFIRTSLFQPLPYDTVNDDFIIPMKIVEKGYRVVYDERLNAIEMEASSNQQDWRRRLRISFGNAQQIAMLKKIFWPKYRGIAFAFLSGKGLRTTMPFFLIFSLLGSVLLSEYFIFAAAAIAQSAVYLLVACSQFSDGIKKIKLIQSLRYLVLGHLANLIGCLRYVFSKNTPQW